MQSLSPPEFRQAFAQFATGITVVTSTGGTGILPVRTGWKPVPPASTGGTGILPVGTGWKPVPLSGMTVNAFCSVSINPPTVLVSLTKDSRTSSLIEQSKVFAVNILSANQSEISDRFAGRHPDKEADRFEAIPWKTADTGAPILEETLAWLDCRLLHTYDGGDHWLYVGQVVAAAIDPKKSPLLFFRSQYLKHANPV